MSAGGKKKIALVFTGAVSLGGFEAGVAFEMIKKIREQDTADLDIDVIVGTSAGALTGALTAMSLVFGTDPKVLQEAWLSVQLDDLLRLNRGDRSLLSSSKVEQLVARFISPVPAADARIPGQGKAVDLVVVVTNLDGISYRIHRANGSDFSISAIGYEDAIRFRITPGFFQWDRLREAVLASSAYPAAFEPRHITRGNLEFRRVARYNFGEKVEKPFHYSDGGIVNNQPLNKAIEIVNDLPVTNGGNGFERVFLVVDPSPPTGDNAGVPENYRVSDVVAKALWTIPRNQDLFRDLLVLEKVNRRLKWKNSFVSATADIWDYMHLSRDRERAINELCNEVAVFKGQKILGIDPAQYLKTEAQRIRSSYKEELSRVKDPDSFVKYCFLLEQVADLRNKQEIAVEMIKPENPEKELAGVIFGNFGGFLDTRFMKHDFEVGRTYARRWLNQERDVEMVVPCTKRDVSPQVRLKLFRKLIENSVPIMVEDIGPMLFTLNRGLHKDVLGIVTFVGMMAFGLAKYVVRKTMDWTKDNIFSNMASK